MTIADDDHDDRHDHNEDDEDYEDDKGNQDNEGHVTNEKCSHVVHTGDICPANPAPIQLNRTMQESKQPFKSHDTTTKLRRHTRLQKNLATKKKVKLHIPVISVHFITNAAIPSTCDAILDEETLFGAFWRDFSKRIAKARRRST